jgi:DNA modification methylase
MSAVLYCGDVRDVLAGLPERSVQMVCTSPPFYGLRDYGTATWEGGEVGCDHIQKRQPQSLAALADRHAPRSNPRNPNRQDDDQINAVAYRDLCGKCGASRVDAQLGLEPTPDAYVAAMVVVFRSVRRVLRDDGVLWCNLGDSYAGSWGAQSREHAGKHAPNISAISANQVKAAQLRESGTGSLARTPGLKAKDLIGIPWRVAFALQADGWYLRSDIIWAKPNPMPESVTDRPTKSHEYLFLLTKSERYYYDDMAIREKSTWVDEDGRPLDSWGRPIVGKQFGNGLDDPRDDRRHVPRKMGANVTDGHRNARTVWTIATQPYAGAHFATFPEELARRCILAGSSAKACETCGAPWERQLERTPMVLKRSERTHEKGRTRSSGTMLEPPTATTVGWQPTCACPANTGAASSVVLDCFGGSGTTAAVAVGHGREAIHIDLNPAYLELARQRIGPMLCTDAPMPEVA